MRVTVIYFLFNCVTIGSKAFKPPLVNLFYFQLHPNNTEWMPLPLNLTLLPIPNRLSTSVWQILFPCWSCCLCWKKLSRCCGQNPWIYEMGLMCLNYSVKIQSRDEREQSYISAWYDYGWPRRESALTSEMLHFFLLCKNIHTY